MIDRLSAPSPIHPQPILLDPRERACAILTHVACDRAAAYRWLALGFYAPGDQLVAAVIEQRLVNGVSTAIAWLGTDRHVFDEALQRLANCHALALPELEAEYQRLFSKGPDRVARHEAAYRWRDASDLLTNCGAIAWLLRLQYQQFDIAPLDERDDHIAVELEFLSFLCERESESWACGMTENARQLRRQQKSFLDDHLGRWLPEFCQRVQARTESDIYHSLAFLADAWLRLEHGPNYLPPVTQA